MTTTQTTKVNRAWLIKRVVLPLIVLLGLGIWGLIDAAFVYPKSGRLFASMKLQEYLKTAEEAGRLTQSFVKVDDPAAELAKLSANEKATAAKDVLSPLERARLEWLRSLKMVWALGDKDIWVANVKRPLLSKTGDQVYAGVGGVSEPKHEIVPMYFQPRTAEGYLVGADKSHQALSVDAVAKQLKDYWSASKATPTPLAFYDLPLQWLFVVAGFGGALYLIVLYGRVISKKYRFEPETHTLVLPGGTAITPADIREVDKRKWHKFYVTLHLKDGPSRTFDLMRHDPLEEWILAMEKVAFPEAQAEEGTRDDDGDPATEALAVSKDVGHVSSMTYGGVMDGVFALFVFDAGAIRAADKSPASYAQGEVLKALSVAMRDEGGWRQWLTAACGAAKGPQARTVVDWLGEREPTFKAAAAHVEPALADLVKNDGQAPNGEWYVVVVGRLSEPVAKKTHEILMDPPPIGLAAFAALRVHPPTIERFQHPLGLEPGMEIKGGALAGSWEASREDIETAGLKVGAGEAATA
jgi:hypothetical protein